jgi:hypothetical protein
MSTGQTVHYGAVTDLQNRLSSVGVALRVDDVPPEPTTGDVMNDADSVIDEHCLLAYSQANLFLSRWVNQRWSDIAAVHLCERRGNPCPPGLGRRYERTLERLEMVRIGRLLIPDIAMSRAFAPVLSNVRVRLAPTPHTVVEVVRSTGIVTDYDQRPDNLDPMQWIP